MLVACEHETSRPDRTRIPAQLRPPQGQRPLQTGGDRALLQDLLNPRRKVCERAGETAPQDNGSGGKEVDHGHEAISQVRAEALDGSTGPGGASFSSLEDLFGPPWSISHGPNLLQSRLQEARTGDVTLKAPPLPATARTPTPDEGDVSAFGPRTSGPGQQGAAHQVPAADPRSKHEHHDVTQALGSTCPGLAEERAVGIVLRPHQTPEPPAETLLDRLVLPTRKVRRLAEQAGRAVMEAGHASPHRKGPGRVQAVDQGLHRRLDPLDTAFLHPIDDDLFAGQDRAVGVHTHRLDAVASDVDPDGAGHADLACRHAWRLPRRYDQRDA